MQPLSVFIDVPNAFRAYAYAWHIWMSCPEIQVPIPNEMKRKESCRQDDSFRQRAKYKPNI